MDSMRSLNTSLPPSSSRRRQTRPMSGDLLNAFKAAALSVTQLYKTAAADEDLARAAGYQDAIDELLGFLDQENLGLGDGEGWRVRQWATERLSPGSYGSDGEDKMDDEIPMQNNNNNNNSNATTANTATTMNDSTPIASELSSIDRHSIQLSESQDRPAQDASSISAIEPITTQNQLPLQEQPRNVPSEIFHFRSNVHLPAPGPNDSETDGDEISNDPTNPSAHVVRLLPRSTRPHSTTRKDKPALTGLKRKQNFSDFFDFSNIGRDGPGGGGGGKRGRFV